MVVTIIYPQTGNCKYCGTPIYGCKGREFCDKGECIIAWAKEKAKNNVKSALKNKEND